MDEALRSQLETPAIDLRAIEQLSGSYKRATRIRAAERRGLTLESAPHHVSGEALWALSDLDLPLEEVQGEVSRPAPRTAELRIVRDGDVRSVHRRMLGELGGNTALKEQVGVVRIAATRDRHQALLNEQLQLLRTAWPEAGAELIVLVDTVLVMADSTGSASIDRALGIILIGDDYFEHPERLTEALLHEGGHQSLLVRQCYDRYLENPDAMVHHPLRPDPRPLVGALHAAHVLQRMTAGLRRCAAVVPDSASYVSAYHANAARLHATVKVVDSEARWTEIGKRYFASLRALAEQEVSV